ncbi:MAG TPA: hypothetical protein VHJ19_08755, partial [Gammaproteobacteria bacterium]|nr:hypothetical protein [Gammaproteobacteria bacterium]
FTAPAGAACTSASEIEGDGPAAEWNKSPPRNLAVRQDSEGQTLATPRVADDGAIRRQHHRMEARRIGPRGTRGSERHGAAVGEQAAAFVLEFWIGTRELRRG